MRRVVLPAILLSLAAAAARADDNTASPPKAYTSLVVERQAVELTVRASGFLVPRNKTVVPAPISGKVEWVVDEGTPVKKGQEVARLDSTEYQDNLEQNKLDLAVAEAELRRAKAQEELVRRQLEFDVKKCALDLERAQLNRSLLGAPTEASRMLSQLTADTANYAMEAAKREYDRTKFLSERGVESTRQVGDARLKYERALADWSKAKADYDLLLKGSPPEDIAVSDQQVKGARTALDLAQKRQTSQADWQATQVRVAEVAVERAKALMALQQGRIDCSHVLAPADGVVIYPRQWGVALRAGDPVWRSNRLLDVADLTDMAVESVVSQVDWPRVRPGQPAVVSLSAFPGRTFKGTVRSVGQIARDRSLILSEEVSNVMSVQVIIDLADRAAELRPSYSAAVAVTTDRCENCIAVPREAVVRRGGRDFVWVREDGRLALRSVGLGSSDASRSIVEKGLAPGDVVLVPARETP